MSVPILVCECGLRLRAPGAVPGRVGRCPKCKGVLKFPDSTSPMTPPAESESGSVGYFLEPNQAQSATQSSDEPKARQRRVKTRDKPANAPTTMADGLLPALQAPETWWLPSVLYPLRGAECMGLIGVVSVAYWILSVLVPEYCLGLMSDAESLGAMPMGHLVSLITSLPVIILIPPALFYLLQYLGRVLVSSALGETIPPRSPDRNFEGFLSGLSPWFIWLLMGVTVSLLPFASYAASRGTEISASPLLAIGLLALGFPYALMALMMSFLHDEPTAAKPNNVIGALFRLFASFLGICVIAIGALAVGVGIFGLAFLLRANHFWLYIFACLASWVCAIWILIVVMRIVGLYYHRHKDVLRWHRDRPRWGVAWKL